MGNSASYYRGETKNGKRHGHGKLYYNRRRTKLAYDGEWSDGKMHGEGKMYYKNGKLKYHGQFVNGVANGQGITYSPDWKSVYEGEFKNDVRHGKGKWYLMDKLLYQGEFLSNYPHFTSEANFQVHIYIGSRKIVYEACLSLTTVKNEIQLTREIESLISLGIASIINASNISNQFKNGYPNFKLLSKYGVFKLYNKGLRYEGDMDIKVTTGSGYYYCPDGSGKYYQSNGLIEYEGQFQDGNMHGYGKIYENGNLEFEGQLSNGLPNGIGKRYYPNGNIKYHGNYINGEASAYGISYREDGTRRYEGEYK